MYTRTNLLFVTLKNLDYTVYEYMYISVQYTVYLLAHQYGWPPRDKISVYPPEHWGGSTSLAHGQSLGPR